MSEAFPQLLLRHSIKSPSYLHKWFRAQHPKTTTLKIVSDGLLIIVISADPGSRQKVATKVYARWCAPDLVGKCSSYKRGARNTYQRILFYLPKCLSFWGASYCLFWPLEPTLRLVRLSLLASLTAPGED